MALQLLNFFTCCFTCVHHSAVQVEGKTLENHGATTFDPRSNNCGIDVAAFEAFGPLLKENNRLRASNYQRKSCSESQRTS